MAPKFEDNVILTKTERLMMSNRPKNPANARNKNVLIVGGSGSGKTRFWLKLPTMEMLPDRSVVVSAGAAALLSATVLSAALLSTAEGCAVAASPLPHATNAVTANIPAPIRANNLLCLTLIIMSSMCLFFFLLITQSY